MDLKTLLGEAYREDMTITEVQEALADIKVIDKSLFDRTASELAKEKKRAKELEQSTLSEQEKVEQAIAEAKAIAESAQKELATISARNTFLESGLTEDQFGTFLSMIDTTDKEIAITKAKEISTLLVGQKEAIEKSVRKELLKETPKPKTQGEETPGGIVFEQFKTMGYEERLTLKEQNPALYSEYSSQEQLQYGGN